MIFRFIWTSVLSLAITSVCVAQTAEYTKKLSGNLEINAFGQVGSYQLDSSGKTSIDQDLGTLVQSWRFANQQPTSVGSSNSLDFNITLVSPSLNEQIYSIKRIEYFQQNAKIQAHTAKSEDELAYCKQENVAPDLNVICQPNMPSDPNLIYSADVYVAIKKLDSEIKVEIESLYLYSAQNSKLISKIARNAKEKYSEAALAWAKKNSQSFLQDKEVYLAHVEFVIQNNVVSWRRQENWADETDSWINDDFRAKTKYVGQGSWEIIEN